MPAVDDLLRATARAEERHFWFRGFRWFVRPLIDQALRGRVRPRILDCGCGTGANLALFERYGTVLRFRPVPRSDFTSDASWAAAGWPAPR